MARVLHDSVKKSSARKSEKALSGPEQMVAATHVQNSSRLTAEQPIPYPEQPSGSEQTPAQYRLQKGLKLIPSGEGGLLLSLRPLMAMRFSASGYAILACLGSEISAAGVASKIPGITITTVTAFLDNLTERRLLKRVPAPPVMWPQVSIIIPAHGRPRQTRSCVESLFALDYPANRLEIIVVDDASTPPLEPALSDLPIRLLRLNANIGQSAARNLAAGKASGEILAFIDNDCVAAKDWLKTLVSHFDQANTGIVGGRVIAPAATGKVAAFEAVRSPLDMGPTESEVGPGKWVAYIPTCNLLVRREVLLQHGGFDPEMRLGEDVDFIWRVHASGNRVQYQPAGQIIHYHRERLWTLLCRRADYASSEADLQQRHPAGWRTMPMPAVSIMLLMALAFTFVSAIAAITFCLLALSRIAFEIIKKQRGLKQLGVNLPRFQIAAAVGRGHIAAFYHLSANTTRYYGALLLVLSWYLPQLLPVAALLLLVAPVSDYRRLQPLLTLPAYTTLYWLEMAAYQFGVWRGCWQQRTLRPLLPRLQWFW